MTDRKFYKTKITFEVLSEEPIPDGMNLDQIQSECYGGSWSKGELEMTQKELNGKQVAKELIKQGSDPEFFGINEKGEDIDF